MLYEKIKDLCHNKNLSIKSVESEANLSNGTISKWNDSVPSASNLAAVAKILDTSVEELLEINR